MDNLVAGSILRGGLSDDAASDRGEPRKPRPARTRDPLIGQVLDGRYRVLRRIGKGGMGVVYLAEHTRLRKRVAIKTLAADALGSQELAERFVREAQAAAAVGDEHIVDVTDMGELDGGLLFFVLEYLEGVDLGWKVAADGPMEPHAAQELLIQLCEALGAVHDAGIVHRDLKPENLFIVRRKQRDFLKVLDFGVCKTPLSDADQARLTATGATLGTPSFMAPEQIEGAQSVDHRADVYAIGAIAHYLLTGSPPFTGATLPKLFLSICTEEVKPLHLLHPQVPERLSQVVVRALAKDPADRFEDCRALARALAPEGALAPTEPRFARFQASEDAARSERVHDSPGAVGGFGSSGGEPELQAEEVQTGSGSSAPAEQAGWSASVVLRRLQRRNRLATRALMIAAGLIVAAAAGRGLFRPRPQVGSSDVRSAVDSTPRRSRDPDSDGARDSSERVDGVATDSHATVPPLVPESRLTRADAGLPLPAYDHSARGGRVPPAASGPALRAAPAAARVRPTARASRRKARRSGVSRGRQPRADRHTAIRRASPSTDAHRRDAARNGTRVGPKMEAAPPGTETVQLTGPSFERPEGTRSGGPSSRQPSSGAAVDASTPESYQPSARGLREVFSK